MRRLSALLIMVLAMAGILSAPASADFSGYRYAGGGVWVDKVCDNPHSAEVIIWGDSTGTGGSGFHTYICASEIDFCQVPLVNNNNPMGQCPSSFTGHDFANDKVSWLTVIKLPVGGCVKLYLDTGYVPAPGLTRYNSGGFGIGWNDAISSLRFRSGSAC